MTQNAANQIDQITDAGKYASHTGTLPFDRYVDAGGTVIYRDADGDTFTITDGKLVPHVPFITLEAARTANQFKAGL